MIKDYRIENSSQQRQQMQQQQQSLQQHNHNQDNDLKSSKVYQDIQIAVNNTDRLPQNQTKSNRSFSNLRHFRPANQGNLTNHNQKPHNENIKPSAGQNKINTSQILSNQKDNTTNQQDELNSLSKNSQNNQQFNEEVFASNLSHRLKSQGKLIGLQRMRSQQTQKQNIASSSTVSNKNNNINDILNAYTDNNSLQGLAPTQTHANNLVMTQLMHNGQMSQRQQNNPRNSFNQSGYSLNNLQQQVQYQGALVAQLQNGQLSNNYDNNIDNTQPQSSSHTAMPKHNATSNREINKGGGGQYYSVEKQSHHNLLKQNSYHSTGKNSANNSGDLTQFRRSMNRLQQQQQKPQSSSQSAQNSSRVLSVNKLFQNEQFQIGDNQKKFFNNLTTAINVQQIDAMQYPKSARKQIGGASAFNNYSNTYHTNKNDQSTFLPPLLDAANTDKIEQINVNNIHADINNNINNNNIHGEASYYSHNPIGQKNSSNNEQDKFDNLIRPVLNDTENENSFNKYSNSVNQPRNSQYSQRNVNQKMNARSLSRQNMNSSKSNIDKDKDKNEVVEKQQGVNTSLINQDGNSSQLSYRKTNKKSSLNNIVKNIYNNQPIKQEPKVLSPTKNKTQNVFKISNNSENRSNSVSGIYGNPTTTNSSSANLNNNLSTNSQSYSQSNKQSNPNIISTNNYQPSTSTTTTTTTSTTNQINQNIMDDSVEEYLEYNQIPIIDVSKTSQKSLGIITAYGANTHQGIVRNYNEDRVSIILNMAKPKDKPEDVLWPNVSFFAIYDGHGGSACAEFLRDNLHYYIIRDENFPTNPQQAIINGFEKLEQTYLDKAQSGQYLDKSGSCCIVSLIVEKTVYIANVGDSRAILSSNLGKEYQDLSEDHKPSLPSEEQRITSLGGHIYQSVIPIYGTNNGSNIQQIQEVIKGPHRAFPGRLAVSRTVGDAEAKLSKYGGIKGVISAEPEIQIFEIQDNHDFVLLGCDGIFDKMSSKETIQCCWSQQDSCKNQHEFVGRAIENTMRQSMMKKSYDNVTVVIVGLKNLESYYQKLNK